MKIYWFIKSIPEYANADKELIKKTWMPSYWKTYKHWQQWIMLIISVSSLIYYISLPQEASLTLNLWSISLLCITWLLWSQVSIALARPYLREILENT